MTAQTPPNPVVDVPHNVEAEEALLGSVLMSADALIDVLPFVAPDDFFIVRNGWIFESMLRLRDRGEQVDYVSVMEELRQQARLDEVGGPAYLTHLLNHTPASLYARTYGHIIERASLRRRLLAAASNIAKLARQEDDDIDAVMDEAQSELAGVVGRRGMEKDDRAVGIANRLFTTVEEARAAAGMVGVPSGFTELDRITGGFHRGDLVYVAGRPGMGKTSWLLSVARHVCGTLKLRVGLMSLEMSDEDNLQRLIAMETSLSTQKMRNGKLDDDEFRLFVTATDTVSRWPLRIDDRGGLSLAQLEAKALRWYNDKGLDLLMVDYIGLMQAPAENRTRELGALSNGLKQLARRLRIPVLVASQLNRGVESRQDKRPKLSDLRESGDLEQDADLVLFLYRDEVYNEDTERPNQCDVILAKHRNGPTGTVALYFRKELTQFANLHKTDVDFTSYNDYAHAARTHDPHGGGA